MEIDTTEPASISAAARTVLANHPHRNVLVTMAGIMRIEDWTTADGFRDSAEATIVTNVLGPIRLIAAFIGHLRAQANPTIMTVSSGLAFTPLKVTPSYNASKAAIHMLSESIRLQLADAVSSNWFPPSVRTGLLPGQQDNTAAMPLDDFVTEVISLLDENPDAPEILVDAVNFLRYGEARGDYDTVVATLNATDPNASS